MFILLFILLI